ncbi:TPA: ABC-2 transporter permease [Clostridioides difficile]
MWRLPPFAQILGFVLSIIFSEFMLCQYLLLKESQYSKASVLLCSTPYPRRGLVQSKYVLFAMVFIYCTLVYWIENLLIPQIGTFDLTYILIVLLISSIIYGVYMPIQYKLGYETTKFFFVMIIMASSFVLPLTIAHSNFEIPFIYQYPSMIVNIVLFLLSLIILLASMFISIKIFSNKELV